MGLEEFIDGLDEPSNDDTNEDSSSNEPEPLNEYVYQGDKELLDISPDDVEQVLEDTQYKFQEKSLPINGNTYCLESENSQFILYVATSWVGTDADCISISVIETEDMYDVLNPRLVFPVAGWKDELEQAINDVVESRSEIEYCERCGSVMIYKKTNVSNEKIKGCSNYPNCMNKEYMKD